MLRLRAGSIRDSFSTANTSYTTVLLKTSPVRCLTPSDSKFLFCSVLKVAMQSIGAIRRQHPFHLIREPRRCQKTQSQSKTRRKAQRASLCAQDNCRWNICGRIGRQDQLEEPWILLSRLAGSNLV